jgi:hypothetical protein
VEDADSKEALVLDDPASVAMITDQRALRYLAPFLSAEHTLSSAASEAGVSPSTMAYWLPRFCAVGLLKMTGQDARAGMASKRYKATADVFVVAADRVDPARLEAIVGAAHDDMGDLLFSRLSWPDLWAAFRLEITGHPSSDAISVSLRPIETDGAQQVIFLLNKLVAMSTRQVRALRDELVATIERHMASAEPGGQYLVQLAIAPVPRD